MKMDEMQAEYNEILKTIDDIDKGADEGGRELTTLEYDARGTAVKRLQSIQKLVDQHDEIETQRKWAEKPNAEPQKDGSPAAGGGLYKPADASKFRTLGDFLTTVYAAGHQSSMPDKRLIRAGTGLNEGVPADGGFLVQTDFASKLLELAFKTGKLAPMCDNITISNTSNSVKVPGINETSRADGSRQGGVRAYWKDEAALKVASQPELKRIQLTLNKLIALTYVTDELLADAPALQSWIMSAFPNEFGFKVDDAIINGTGAGQPLGIINSPALVSVAIEAGQAGSTVVAENIEKMYSRMLPDSIPNATWFISQDVWPQLFQLHHEVGTGGVPVFIPASAGLVNAPFGMLLGRPIMPIEQCQTLGTKGDVIFADMKQYYFASKGGIQSDSSIHVKFIYDETAYRWTARYDGQPKLTSAVTPFNGGSTISPFVTLDARP